MVRITIDTSPEGDQPKYKRVKCKICDGTCKDFSNALLGAPCATCGATGWREFPIGPTQPCPNCRGRGKDIRFAMMGIPCKMCNAFGEIPI